MQRVKILYNKKDSALIQMAEPHQAHLGNGFELFTCRVKVYFAKEGFICLGLREFRVRKLP